MGKLSYNDKLRMQTLRERGLSEKAIISSYPDKGWKLSMAAVELAVILRKPGSGRPATASTCAVCRCVTIPKRDATRRTAIPPTRRRHLRTFWKMQQGSNCLRHAAGCRKLLRYGLFGDVYVERKTLAVRCIALPCVVMETTHIWAVTAGTMTSQQVPVCACVDGP